jgi:hypothetical protein
MTSTSKLRIAVPDVADALDAVKFEVEEATGFAVEPVFQEIDRSELVVELCLADSNAADPRRVALAVESSAGNLDVLSTWNESPLPRDLAPRASETVFKDFDYPMPEVARRALSDELPTAQWLPTVDDVGRGDRSLWLLAVPVIRSDGPSLVGVRHRHGYSLRFSAHEAASARIGLAS